jgi:hypothetical protein
MLRVLLHMTLNEVNAILPHLPKPPEDTKCGWTEWNVEQPSEVLGTGWVIYCFAYARDERYGGTGLAERIELRQKLLEVGSIGDICTFAARRMAHAEESMRRAVAHYVANALVNPKP